MKFKSFIVACTLLFTSSLIHAQSLALNLTATPAHPFGCSNFNPGTPNCYGLQFVDSADGSEGSIWLDDTFMTFPGGYKGIIATHIKLPAMVGNGTASYDFTGTDADGNEFSGALTWTYYMKRMCGRGCYNYGFITGGSITITY